MRTVAAISPLQVGHVWPAVAPLVAEAMAYGDGGHAPDDILDAIRRREMTLWLGIENGAPKMAVVTEIAQKPRKRIARVVLASGTDIDGWYRAGWSQIEDWARDEGCEGLEMIGRRGWKRKLPGWSVDAVVMRRAL